MTVGQLKEILKNVPDTVDVFIRQCNDEFDCSLVESAREDEINFSDGENEANEEVFILSDEI